jgi:uncharacterized repeat protein (TIGR03803 family)
MDSAVIAHSALWTSTGVPVANLVSGPIFTAQRTLTLCLLLASCGGGGGGTSGYTLGGAVTGLAAGSKVTLSNNGSGTVSITGDEPFTFAVTVAAGSPYTITVTSQPVGQTCTVKNGTGSNVMANITNVVVTCDAMETVLHSFGAGTDGSQPDQLTQAKDGNLYGVTAAGGVNGNGTVFKISPAGTETVLYSFAITNGIDGREPVGSLVQTSDGNFYGLTFFGGAAQDGTLFQITPDGYESVVHTFGVHSNDGMFPNPSLVLGMDGNFYGTTLAGGAHGIGVAYEVTPLVLETIFYDFDDSPPTVTFIQAADGTFYGTNVGGQYGNGLVYSLTPGGEATVVYNFGTAAADGKQPVGGLLEGSDGNFYGVTVNGGANNTGTVFRVSPAGVVDFLYAFGPAAPGNAGSTPQAGLIQAKDGNFYGTTSRGGTNNTGTVYQLSASGTVSTLYSFGPASGTDGTGPVTSLVQGTDGSLYGTTPSGGAFQSGGSAPLGTVFRID